MPTPGNITAFPALGKKTSVFHNILTVCTGNICRSPVAEYLLRHEIALAGRKADVRSAGIGALVDHPADDTALLVMDELGVPMQAHRARQIKVEHTRWADLILVMQSHHLEYVLSLDPTAPWQNLSDGALEQTRNSRPLPPGRRIASRRLCPHPCRRRRLARPLLSASRRVVDVLSLCICLEC